MTTLPITGLDLQGVGVTAALAADTAAHRGAAPAIRDAVAALAASGRPFTAEDVRERIAADPHVSRQVAERTNVLPAVFSAAASAGTIRAIGYTRATRRSRHASVLRIWQGVAA